MVSGNIMAHAMQLRANRSGPPFDLFLGDNADFVSLIAAGILLPLTSKGGSWPVAEVQITTSEGDWNARNSVSCRSKNEWPVSDCAVIKCNRCSKPLHDPFATFACLDSTPQNRQST
jgi:hypothetical protein